MAKLIEQEIGIWQELSDGDMRAVKLYDLGMRTVQAIYIEVEGKLIKTTMEELKKSLAQRKESDGQKSSQYK